MHNVDAMLGVLACERQEIGLYKSKLLEGATISSHCHYQISGAIGWS